MERNILLTAEDLVILLFLKIQFYFQKSQKKYFHEIGLAYYKINIDG